MADPEHLDLLKQGVSHWNQWRRENPAIQPTLSGADLQDASLQGANLQGANLQDASLDWRLAGDVTTEPPPPLK